MSLCPTHIFTALKHRVDATSASDSPINLRTGERRPPPCSAARHPALLRRGDTGPQDWSDDRNAAASLSFHCRIDGVTPHAPHAQVLVMSVMFVGFVVLLHIYGKLTAVPDAVDEDPIMPETPGADA